MGVWWGRSWAVAFLVGCGPVVPFDPEPGSESGDADESSTSGSSSATTAGTSVGPSSATAPPPTTTPQPTTIDPDPTDATTDGGLPNGAQCMNHPECASAMCYLAGILGGLCGECLTEFDCEWGCTGPNPLADPPMGAYCNDGLYGDGCETDAACMGGLRCATILDIPSVLTRSTCGECTSDDDCPFGTLCSPQLDIVNIGGEHVCVSPGSIPLGGFCDLQGSGDEQCGSGICGTADIMGLLQFGVCSECRSIDDCIFGATACVPPMIDLDGTVIAGYCA